MREMTSRFLRRLLRCSDFPRSCFTALTVLAVPVQLDGVDWMHRAQGAGPAGGCCVLPAGAAETDDSGPDSTLDSWLVVREKPPSTAPPADTVATRTTTHTTVLPKHDMAESDWRLMPFVAAQTSGGKPGQPTLLSIAVSPPYGQPNPQHEAVTYVTVEGLPEKAGLSNGERGADGAWTVQLEQLSDLSMTFPSGTAETVTLHITAVTDHGGGVVAKQGVTLVVPVSQAPVSQALAAAEPAPADTAPPPAQGGSSQGGSSHGPVIAATADPVSAEAAAGSGSSSPAAPQEPRHGDAILHETPPDLSAERMPERETATAAPPIDAPPAVQAAVQPIDAAPPPPEPPAATGGPVTLAAIPAVAAPPTEPQTAQQREDVVQRPAKPPSTIPQATLMKRGDDLFAQGDLAGARLYYEMAAETGNAKAAFALGRTHDPLVHERLHVRGLPPDAEQAAAWYRRAVAAGSSDAEQQLRKLTDWLARRTR
ncbi:tetratricopeptide repeat protein [Azospirillum sp. B506]|uniref:tetratricopeptide repeat protein n=1 Tax=Azospirillum sp. B506 TaxID=137721 RepID=UPI000349168E|nr:sel1 repeat family protein [Azospirillum sp. B506]